MKYRCPHSGCPARHADEEAAIAHTTLKHEPCPCCGRHFTKDGMGQHLTYTKGKRKPRGDRKEKVMITEDVKRFQEAVSRAHWNLGYNDFCRRLGKAEPDSRTEVKWNHFKRLDEALRGFDHATLAKLLAPEQAEWTAEEIIRQEG